MGLISTSTPEILVRDPDERVAPGRTEPTRP